jgi:hypothetical protein
VTAGAGNDSLVDSPTSYGTDTGAGGEVRGNYATWNAVLQTNDAANTYTNGNLEVSATSSNWANGTISTNTGSYYFELTASVGASGLYLGINNTKTDVRVTAYSGGIEASPGGGSNQGSLAAWSNGDIIGVAVNGVSKTVQFYRNGSTYGTLVTYTTALDLFPFARNGSISSSTVIMNAGQRAFAYTAPSGFKALCTQNLPTPTIGATTATQAGTYFNTITWSGTGSGSTRSLTGVGFQPDWVWTKSRSAGYDHQIYDAVRGAGSTKSISSNSANSEAQGNVALYGYVSAFNSDGFTGTNGTDGSIPSAYYNQSGQTYVAWNWKESVTAGFDIVTYTGTGANRTVAHNLGVAPKMIFIKASNLNAFWQVYNADNGATKTIYLNATNAATTDSTSWNNTAPTSSVFTVGTNSDVNSNTYSYVAYCFAEVAGYSKFGSYVGNSSTDGPFVFTGFRPAYVLYKGSSTSGGAWDIHDDTRSPSNEAVQTLFANTAGAEGGVAIDILSNGFKIRDTSANANSSGVTYIYAAFADSPFKYSLAR